MKKTVLILLMAISFGFASIGVNIDTSGIENKRVFRYELLKNLRYSGIRFDSISQYLLKIKVGKITNAKSQKVRIKFKLYNGLVPFYDGDTIARYSISGSSAKEYITKSIAQKAAKLLKEQLPYMHRHLRQIKDYHFNSFDFNADKKIDFTLSPMDGKEDMLFLDPKNKTLFAKAKDYNNLRSYNINKKNLSSAAVAVYAGVVLIFKTKDGKFGKLRVLNIKGNKMAFEWKWL